MLPTSHPKPAFTYLLTSVALLALSACNSTPSPIINPGFKSARAQSSLEIPPDLINSTSDAIKRPQNQISAAGVLPDIEGLQLEGSGMQRYLRVNADADQTWAKLQDFATKSNLPILSESKRDGILETDWIGDTSTETNTQTRMRALLGNIIGRPAINDKYKFWLERLGAEETAVHVEHSKLNKQVIEPKNQHDVVVTNWREAPGNESQVLAMLRHMAAFFSGQDDLNLVTYVVLVTDSSEHIVLAEPKAQAWSTIGNALKRTQYQIKDVKRDKDIYLIKAPKAQGGFLSKLSIKPKMAVKIEALSDEKSKITITKPRGGYLDREDALPVLYALTGELRK